MQQDVQTDATYNILRVASADELVQQTIIAKSQNKMLSHVCAARTRNLNRSL